MNKKQLTINMMAGLVALTVSMGINLVLSPYIVSNVGEEAYGFVQLSNNFIAYFSLLTIALNSMSSRFISISYFAGDQVTGNGYYSSTFFSNILLNIVFIPIIVLGIINLNNILDISTSLIFDVKLLFGFMAINFLINLLATNLGICYYLKNKLYIESIIQIIGNVIRAVLLYVLFTRYKPYIAYIGLVAVFISLFSILCNLYVKNKIMPELKISIKKCNLKMVKTLIASGVWNTITRVGSLLQEGLDLLIANLMISPKDMGILAIAKTIPNLINSLLYSMISSFIPNITEQFAKNQIDELRHSMKQSMKIIGMIINIPIALLIGYGNVLFMLWQPTQDSGLLQILSIITISPWAIMGPATIIHNLFSVVNKVKTNSILVCATGLLNIITVFFLLKYTSLGLFAVAGVSTVYGTIRNLLYTVPYGAKYIKCPWYTFYPEVLKSFGAVIFISFIAFVMKRFMPEVSWFYLSVFAIVTALIGFVFNYYMVLNKEDRRVVLNKLRRRINNG